MGLSGLEPPTSALSGMPRRRSGDGRPRMNVRDVYVGSRRAAPPVRGWPVVVPAAVPRRRGRGSVSVARARSRSVSCPPNSSARSRLVCAVVTTVSSWRVESRIAQRLTNGDERWQLRRELRRPPYPASARDSGLRSSLVTTVRLMMNCQRARVAPEHGRPALGAVVRGRSADCSADADEFVTCAGSSPA